MNDGEIKLISRTPTITRDRRGQVVYNETSVSVVCDVVPVSRDEFFNGAQVGIEPAYQFNINPIEYNGQKIVEYNGRRFSVYRIYETGPDTLELYVEYTAGINGGADDDS